MIHDDPRVAQAWDVLQTVLDPEVPALSVCDLGIVRDVRNAGVNLEVHLTPTYSGCPATEVIEHDVKQALEAAGLGPVMARTVLSPAWTSDWISEAGREKLRAYGIAPPGRCGDTQEAASVIMFMPNAARAKVRREADVVRCPQCNSADTERLSAFGATACKALHRCLACREPFEAFKAI